RHLTRSQAMQPKTDVSGEPAHLISQLLAATDDRERTALVNAFSGCSNEARLEVEALLVGFLDDSRLDHVARSWMPTLLGRVRSQRAKTVLMERLPIEADDLVRRSIVRSLIRNFDGDDRVRLILERIDTEEPFHNLWYFCKALGESGNSLATEKLIALLAH